MRSHHFLLSLDIVYLPIFIAPAFRPETLYAPTNWARALALYSKNKRAKALQ